MAKKQCPDCGLMVGVRTKNCPDCDHKFLIRKRGARPKQVEWTELKRGDVIKCVQGTGPYWVNKETGERVGFNFRGKYKVDFIDRKGIGAYPEKNKTESGFCYIYMGKPKFSKESGIHSRPHKILGINTEATIIEKTKSRKKNITKSQDIDTEELNNLIQAISNGKSKSIIQLSSG